MPGPGIACARTPCVPDSFQGDLLSPDEPSETRKGWITVPVFLYRNAAGDYATVGRDGADPKPALPAGSSVRDCAARARCAAEHSEPTDRESARWPDGDRAGRHAAPARRRGRGLSIQGSTGEAGSGPVRRHAGEGRAAVCLASRRRLLHRTSRVLQRHRRQNRARLCAVARKDVDRSVSRQHTDHHQSPIDRSAQVSASAPVRTGDHVNHDCHTLRHRQAG